MREFELLSEAQDEEFELALNRDFAARVDALLSKVSEPGATSPRAT